MNDLDTMQLLLCALLLISGLLRLLRRTYCRSRAAAALPAFAVVTGYGFFSAALCLVIGLFAGISLLLPALLLLTGFASAAAAAEAFPHVQERNEVIAALLTAVWLAAFLAVTVFLRTPGETGVLLHFDAFADVSRLGSLQPLFDVLLNILLFLPLGLLLPWADHHPHVWLNVLSTALMLTASVEAVQLLYSLGQADVEDLAANILGAMAGLMLHRITARPSRT